MKKRKKISWNKKCYLCIFPGLLGMILFSFLPFFRVIYFALIRSQFQPKFVGFNNFIRTWNNKYFRLALKNSLLLILRDVPVLLAVSLCLSLLIFFTVKGKTGFKLFFILPIAIPTAGIVVVWKLIFGGTEGTLPIDLLFLWKNMGLCMILLTAALSNIPGEIFEAAKIDGAGGVRLHWCITLPILRPVFIFTVLLSIMNSYKIFKESFLYYGTSYPPNASYTLQYYMNNHFLKLDYQSLATSAIFATFISLLSIGVGLKMTKRFQS